MDLLFEMTDQEYIKILEERLRSETERADRNYEVATFFENLYEEVIDWVTSDEVE